MRAFIDFFHWITENFQFIKCQKLYNNKCFYIQWEKNDTNKLSR